MFTLALVKSPPAPQTGYTALCLLVCLSAARFGAGNGQWIYQRLADENSC